MTPCGDEEPELVNNMKMKYGAVLLSSLLTTSVLATSGEIDCAKAATNYEVNHCAAIELEQAQKELQRYLKTSLDLNQDDRELSQAILNAQQSWEQYYEAHCQAILTKWREGTIRTTMVLTCKTQLTKLRTHELWASFLTYVDNTSPELPEPQM